MDFLTYNRVRDAAGMTGMRKESGGDVHSLGLACSTKVFITNDSLIHWRRTARDIAMLTVMILNLVTTLILMQRTTVTTSTVTKQYSSNLSLSLCLSVSACLSVSVSLGLCLSLSLSLSVSLSVSVFVSVSLCLSVSDRFK